MQIQADSFVKKIGPGVITGAADDDPSGIATYSQAGAQFGFSMLWTVLFTYPLMVGIQIISARIGRVTGKGLAANIRHHYPNWLLYFIVGLLLVANTINIAADISAMGDAVVLVFGGSSVYYCIFFGLVSVILQVFIPYKSYVYVLKWLTLSLLAYVATAFAVHIPWGEVFKETFIPSMAWSTSYVTTVVAVFGTTISPYLFFWQASQEVEEQHAHPNNHAHANALRRDPTDARVDLHRIKIDTYWGMAFSNIVAFFIILTAAATLHVHGITDIETSAQAAAALRPLGGDFAFALFTLGIIGTGMLAVPVLAGSAAYAVAESFHWKSGLDRKPLMAKRFYTIIVFSTLGGVALTFSSINPIKALYWSAVINGVISVPIMFVMMLIAARTDIMGTLVARTKLKILGWGAVVVMTVAVIAMFWAS